MSTKHTIDRIIRANPVPDVDHVHRHPGDAKALLLSIERRREEMQDLRTPQPVAAERKQVPWYRRPQTVFVAAALVVFAIMLPVALLGRQGSEVADEPPASTTMAPATATTLPEAPPPEEQATPVAPVEPAAAVPYDDLIVDGHMVIHSGMSDGPDGMPLIAYYYESAEAFFENTQPSDAGVGIVRCHDERCLDFERVEIPYAEWPAGESWLPLEFDALLPDGSPVFTTEVEPPGDWSEDNPIVSGIETLLVCADAECSSMDQTPLETPDTVDLIMGIDAIVVAEDGYPAIYIQSNAPPKQAAVQVIDCADRLCSNRETRMLVEDASLGAVTPDNDGGIRIEINRGDGSHEALACDDLTCTSPELRTADEVAAEGTLFRIWGSVRDPENSPGIATIVEERQPRRVSTVDLGVPTAAGQVAVAPGADGRLVLVFATDPVDLNAGDPVPVDLYLSQCVDEECLGVTTRHVASPVKADDVAAGRWWDSDGAFSMRIGDDGVPLIAYGTIDGLHLIRCTDAACAPPG